jgi:hypothetical protein
MFVHGAACARTLERRANEKSPLDRRRDSDQFFAYLKILEKSVTVRCRSW